MAIKSNSKKKVKKINNIDKPFEQKANLSKLSLYIVIVPAGVGNTVVKILQNCGSSFQFSERGQGTANDDIIHILGLDNSQKDIVFGIIRDSKINETKKELEAFFLASRRNKGIGFTIPFTSIMGVSIYKFLTQTL